MRLQEYEKDHLARLRPHLAECAVLLKRKGDFPLDAPGELALYGSGARHTVKGGTGSGDVNSRYFLTAEDGLRAAGFTITTGAWLDGYDAVKRREERRFIQEIKARSRMNRTIAALEGMGAAMPEPEYALPLNGAGDTAVYVLSRVSGEGSDRTVTGGDVLLSGPEIRDILALQRNYSHFMLVLNVGGPVDLSPVADAVDNILLLSQLGVETGTVLSDLLLGRAYPSGKLTATWAAWADYPGLGDFGKEWETCYREGVYVGYRYFDSAGVKPLFPFGFGLGYTDFALTEQETRVENGVVSVSVTVRNTGCWLGRETVQLYVSCPEGELDQPAQTLAAFAKTGELGPGESQRLSLSVALTSLASFDEKRLAYVLEAGDYLLRLGVSSRDNAPLAVVRLNGGAVVRRVRSLCGEPGFTDWRPPWRLWKPLPPELPVLDLSPEEIAPETVDYSEPEGLTMDFSGVSDRDLARLCLGVFDEKRRLPRIGGDSAVSVAGAAGETHGLPPEIPALVLSDGPAGLRLSPTYAEDEKGVHALGSPFPADVRRLLSRPARAALRLLEHRPPKGAVIREQYCTALPIGTALAQSWDPAFARLCGEIVGEEMARFGVDLWLAPALNIQRDIRCGRNFEYFSEDPLLSGVFAAALTQGVQSLPGRGVTVKHFAANNQETNRFDNDSRVSQRALREIYLRGFALCLREAAPKALMTSYNLLNGEHTAERGDLVEGILRREFGFRGLVMTDWIVDGMSRRRNARHSVPDAGRILEAGGNLVMPGSRRDWEAIQSALRRGSLSRQRLERCAAGVAALARELKREQET